MDLTFTWQASAVGATVLGVACLALASLERPHSKTPDVHKQRQSLACAALWLQALSCLVQAGYFYMKSIRNPSAEFKVRTGIVGRSAMCLTYASVMVVSWQWSLLCGRIFEWKHKSRPGYALLAVFTVFVGFYMGTAYDDYSGKSSQSFTIAVNAFVSGQSSLLSLVCPILDLQPRSALTVFTTAS
jgi:hypothetical protein